MRPLLAGSCCERQPSLGIQRPFDLRRLQPFSTWFYPQGQHLPRRVNTLQLRSRALCTYPDSAGFLKGLLYVLNNVRDILYPDRNSHQTFSDP